MRLSCMYNPEDRKVRLVGERRFGSWNSVRTCPLNRKSFKTTMKETCAKFPRIDSVAQTAHVDSAAVPAQSHELDVPAMNPDTPQSGNHCIEEEEAVSECCADNLSL